MTSSQLNQPCFEEWLRKNSGINKKYFEGEAYKELRTKVKASSRYARSEFKATVRVYLPPYQPLADNVW
jgi:hypothetical protein